MFRQPADATAADAALDFFFPPPAAETPFATPAAAVVAPDAGLGGGWVVHHGAPGPHAGRPAQALESRGHSTTTATTNMEPPMTTTASDAPATGEQLRPAHLTFPFAQLCAAFDAIAAAPSKREKLAVLERLWGTALRGADFHPFMRLIVPQLDTERATYGLQESKIARTYVSLLGLPPNSPDATRMLRWKDPTKNSYETTSFSDVVYVVLAKRGFAASSPPTTVAAAAAGGAEATSNQQPTTGTTVAGLNAHLDALASPTTNQDAKKATLMTLIRTLSASEQRWMLRILVKDMRFGLGHVPILGALHPHALEYYNATSDLRAVCRRCTDPSALRAMAAEAAAAQRAPVVPGATPGSTVYLNRPFRPMLASVVDPEKLAVLLHAEPVVAEPKYDGERMLIHYTAGGAIRYFTRNGKDYTASYGPLYDAVLRDRLSGVVVGPNDAGAHTTAVTASGAKSPIRGWTSGGAAMGGAGAAPAAPTTYNTSAVRSCILDGEFLLFDASAGGFMPFGSNRTHATSGAPMHYAPDLSQAVGASGSRWFCYCIFDLLLLDGESLVRRPLQQRQVVLRTHVAPKATRLEIVPHRRVISVKDVLGALDDALAMGHEGLMLKALSSPYVPGERRLNWTKLKPDHVAGMADTLDLIVLGAYYGTKYGTRQLSHFLLGVWAGDSSGGVGGDDKKPSYASAFEDEKDTSKKMMTGPIADGGGIGATVVVPNASNSGADLRLPRTSSPRDPGASFVTVCKVGSGYTAAELRGFTAPLESKWLTFPPGAVPGWLAGWRPAADDVPDVWIHPSQSIVLEIFGYSFTPTIKFLAGSTVRFPRFKRVRVDKSIEDATDLGQLLRIMEAAAAGRRKAADLDRLVLARDLKRQDRAAATRRGRDDSTMGNTARLENQRTFARRHGAFEVLDVDAAPAAQDDKALAAVPTAVTQLLSGLEVCVLACSSAFSVPPRVLSVFGRDAAARIPRYGRPALVELVRLCGAHLVANPRATTAVLLADSAASVKVQHWVAAARRPAPDAAAAALAGIDVLTAQWLTDSIVARRRVPVMPAHVLYASPALVASLEQRIDRFEDAYVTDATAASLARSLDLAARTSDVCAALAAPLLPPAPADAEQSRSMLLRPPAATTAMPARLVGVPAPPNPTPQPPLHWLEGAAADAVAQRDALLKLLDLEEGDDGSDGDLVL